MSELFRAAQRPFFALAFVALLAFCLSATREYAVPIAIAVLIWFLINALAGAIRRAPRLGPKVPPPVAKAISVLVLFGATALAARVVVANVAELGAGVQGGQEVVLAKLEGFLGRLGIEANITPEQVFDLLAYDALIGYALATAQGLLADVSLVFLYVLFLLVDERFYEAKLRALVPDDAKRNELKITLARIGAETRLYLWLMTLISAGVALMTYAACDAVGLSGAGFWGFVAFVLNFIPTIGSITAVVLPCVYALLTLENPVAVFMLIGVLAATQFVAGEIVLPRLMGDRLNLSSVVILLTLVVWGAMWGPAGMFLAIPITVIIVLICARLPVTRPIAIALSRDGRLPQV
ncbi:MAG: AI-2E family transporter [Pikeienuella sp.]